MPSGFTIKDSGKREEYPSGMRRDLQDGKPRYDLVDLEMLTRWATHMGKGAEKYGSNNWQLANSQEEADRFRSSAFRHLIQWVRGDRDEDHASAVFFNIAAYEYVMKKIDEQKLQT